MFHLYEFRVMILFVMIPFDRGVSGQEAKKNSSVIVDVNLPEDLVKSLYEKYTEAVEDAKNQESLRRLYTRNKEYKIHVKRLKEVNGYKIHNLLIKEESKPGNPFIYINNPVESKLPNAYLTLEEFKNALTNRIRIQKDNVARINKGRIVNLHATISKEITVRETREYKPTRTHSRLRSESTMKRTRAKTTRMNLIKRVELKSKKNIKRIRVKPNSTKKAVKKNILLRPIRVSKIVKSTPISRHNNTISLRSKDVIIHNRNKDKTKNTKNALDNTVVIADRSKNEEDIAMNENNRQTKVPTADTTIAEVDNSNGISTKEDTKVSNTDVTVTSYSTLNTISTDPENTTLASTNLNIEDASTISTNSATEASADTTLADNEATTADADIIDGTTTYPANAESFTDFANTNDSTTDSTNTDNENATADTAVTEESTTEAAMAETEYAVTNDPDDYPNLKINSNYFKSTTTTKRTWKTLGRPAVYMGGDMEI